MVTPDRDIHVEMNSARFEIRHGKKRLSRRKHSFWVVTIGENGEILQTSEMLTSRNACYTNISAMRGVGLKGYIVDTTDESHHIHGV